MRAIRHGDVILTEATIPGNATLEAAGPAVLAEGEATGHAHVIDSPEIETWTVEGEDIEARFLRVLAQAGVELTHEEHATIVVPAGDWQVGRQREYAPEAPVWVVD